MLIKMMMGMLDDKMKISLVAVSLFIAILFALSSFIRILGLIIAGMFILVAGITAFDLFIKKKTTHEKMFSEFGKPRGVNNGR